MNKIKVVLLMVMVLAFSPIYNASADDLSNNSLVDDTEEGEDLEGNSLVEDESVDNEESEESEGNSDDEVTEDEGTESGVEVSDEYDVSTSDDGSMTATSTSVNPIFLAMVVVGGIGIVAVLFMGGNKKK